MSPDQQSAPAKLTDKQLRFIDEYCVDWNCTQAAIRAGYAEKNAGQEGNRLYKKVEIKAAIDARLRELSLSAGQTTKLISEIAETRLNEFTRIVTVPSRTRKEAYANVVLQQVNEEIALLQEKATPLKKKEAAPILRAIGKLRARQVELELEVLRFGKTAIVYVDGPLELVERVELDLVALARAKDSGRIKSWTPTEFGIKVELYDASAALRDMGRVHGIFEKDNDQSKPTAVLNTKVEVISSGVPIARSEQEAAANV